MKIPKWGITFFFKKVKKEPSICEKRESHRATQGMLTHDKRGKRRVECHCLDCGQTFLRKPTQEDHAWFHIIENI